MAGYDSVGVLDPREGRLQQRVLLNVRSGLRGFLHLLLVGVHLRHEGFHRGLLSRRGLLVLPTLLGGLRSSCIFLSSGSD